MRRYLSHALVVGILLTVAIQIVWVGTAKTETDVTIPRGANVHEISRLLSARGVIANQSLFEGVVRLRRAETSLQAGEYRFPAHPSIPTVVRLLRQGPRHVERMIRILEGWDAREMAQFLHNEIGISEDEFLALVRQPPERLFVDFPWLPEQTKTIGLEGYLLGDTYQILKESRAEEVVKKMLANFEIKALPVLQKTPKGYPLDLHETLTLASVVESEVATWQDRRMVADIFLRRLRYGMALQADSTVNYATGKNRSRASLDDLEHPSPYNTYKLRGLPPGPITNPSVLSLWAVLQPIRNPYWYFLTDRAGNVYYSKTFTEHKNTKADIYGSR